jgi:hypothetical protein
LFAVVHVSNSAIITARERRNNDEIPFRERLDDVIHRASHHRLTG